MAHIKRLNEELLAKISRGTKFRLKYNSGNTFFSPLSNAWAMKVSINFVKKCLNSGIRSFQIGTIFQKLREEQAYSLRQNGVKFAKFKFQHLFDEKTKLRTSEEIKIIMKIIYNVHTSKCWAIMNHYTPNCWRSLILRILSSVF